MYNRVRENFSHFFSLITSTISATDNNFNIFFSTEKTPYNFSLTLPYSGNLGAVVTSINFLNKATLCHKLKTITIANKDFRM